MRTIPVDSTRAQFIGTGKAAARAQYAELSDGSRRRTGEQDKDEHGVPLWVIDVLVDDDDADRAEVIGVRVASWDEPKVDKWKPVRFINLVAVPYADRSTGRVALSMRADGIDGQGQQKPAAA
ncbi:hypothetical protein GCM10010472_52250 [Pseudonocardia halophobica]|uniref:Plasmid replication, integration and excision activator n=1 Tax=Pseudonocardia halophobica TaxID=29401 RepID=A0A9W6L3C5_9PSEU|nr:hypothetical protein [Pseudonocardia halophobica]GLL11361.1 hypothetical protein GCM10017577_25020 [Pseudonocardia halophobica]